MVKPPCKTKKIGGWDYPYVTGGCSSADHWIHHHRYRGKKKGGNISQLASGKLTVGP